ncbi:MAG: hypothetical protein H6581_18625 [Bacteroidia bacterium]|nr:hypothetical protein [Bacteroidia bacterium]
MHNLFDYDRSIYNYLAHPQWDEINSENLLVKILFADYERQYAVLELLGDWNDLYQNDFKLLAENCLTYLVDEGINQIILIVENVFNTYLGEDDYYEAMQDELGDGWICLLRPREQMKMEIEQYGIDRYLFWSPALDEIRWRKLKPLQLFEIVHAVITRPLLGK